MKPTHERLRKRIQRACSCGRSGCGGCAGAQRSPRGEAPEAVPQSVYEVLRSPGQPLDATKRQHHQTAIGHDLGAIRIHNDAAAGMAASDMNAHAFTIGSHIVVADDGPDLSTPDGRALLRHELTHATEHQAPWNPQMDGVGMLSMQATDSADERDAARESIAGPGLDEDEADAVPTKDALGDEPIVDGVDGAADLSAEPEIGPDTAEDSVEPAAATEDLDAEQDEVDAVRPPAVEAGATTDAEAAGP